MLRLAHPALCARAAVALALVVPNLLIGQLPALEVASFEATATAMAFEPAAAPIGVTLGRSGALRVVVASPGSLIDLAGLGGTSDTWSSPHRWIALQPDAGPRLLGAPAPAAIPEVAAEYTSAIATGGFVEAPSEPGVWRLESEGGVSFTVITQVPATEVRGGRLNGYHIGTYPTAGSNRTDEYAPPTAFIEVTPELRDLPLSEHLVLGQFLTKDQFDVWPKYVALELRLIDKLELVIQELNAMGIRAERMHVMSGFRTPQYNGPGGDGRASLSRHMWGDAADVWIDNLGLGQMDDLNGDGQVDLDDAAVMMRAVERVERKYPELIGGAGTYPTTPVRGPYIHIDVRGHHSRW